MGTPINTPLTSEIWHLTIDDLLEPVPAAPCLGGPGPFVINLSASTAPISLPMKAVADHPGTHVYQIQRSEDRRVRYRLRLGPFETEKQAEALLPVVREIYPSALTASAEPEDLRAIETIKTRIEAQQLAAVRAAMSKAAAALPGSARSAAAPAAPSEPAPEPPASSAPADGGDLPTTPPPAWLALQAGRAAPAPQFAPARFSASARAFVPNAGFVGAPPIKSAPAAARPPAPAPAAAAPAAPAPAGPAVPRAAASAVPVSGLPSESLIPVLSDSMAVPRPATAALKPAAAPAPAPTPAAAVPAPQPAHGAPAAAPAHAAAAPAQGAAPMPVTARPPAAPLAPPRAPAGAPRVSSTPISNFDMTQTLRPLTPTELEDASALRWFVIQLSCSEEAFDPDALPNLDIFSEYRLYSVASMDQGKLMHALRLGFFSEEAHAKAVAGYLGSFYDSPTVKRVSTAERTRFAQHRVEARKDIGATGKHAVIEITDERVIRPKRPANPPGISPSPTPPSARGR